MKSISVLLADDHRNILESVRQLIGKAYDVVDAVEDGQRAVDATLKLDPDILVLDISMPLMNGFEAASRLQKVNCRTHVIFLTIREDEDYIDKAFSVGARGYVTKRHLANDLPLALHEVIEGRTYISPSLSAAKP